MKNRFDFDKAVKELVKGKKISGKDGILAPLIKQLVEAALEAEIESHISNEILKGKKNRRNGYNRKKVKSKDGEFESWQLQEIEKVHLNHRL